MKVAHIQDKVIALVLFFLPFSAIKGFSFLGELKHDLAAHFFVLAILLFLIRVVSANKILIPQKTAFYFLTSFLIWALVSLAFNADSVWLNFYKGKHGMSRFVLQLVLYVFYALLGTLLFYEYIVRHTVKEAFYRFRKITLYSFLFVSLVGLIEIPIAVYHKPFLKPVYDFFTVLTLKDPELAKIEVWRFDRIASITQEPPFLAMYLLFAGPFMMSYLLDKKLSIMKFLPTGLLLILTYYSGSRTALLVVLIQLAAFVYYGFRSQIHQYRFVVLLFRTCMLIFFGLIVFFEPVVNIVSKKMGDFQADNTSFHNTSNKTRLGTQQAALYVFTEHPLVGVGLGQQGYYLPKFYPKWAATPNWEIKMYRDDTDPTWPPGFSMFTRLLCETGVLGCVLFFGATVILLLALRLHYLKYYFKNNLESLITLVGLLGFAINLLQFDSFRLIGFWLTFAMACAILRKEKQQEKQQNEQNTALPSSL